MLGTLWWWLRSLADFLLGLVGDAWHEFASWSWPRQALTVAGMVGVAVLLITVDLPSLATLRGWADVTGDGFVVVFWFLYVVVTQFPVPRTFLTLASGILFGPVVGTVVALSATTVAAVVSLVIVRGLLGEWMRPRLNHPAVASINQRLAERGWLAVGSLRLIAGVPFSVLNYVAALSSVKVLPFAVATLLGSAPNTLIGVLFGDALTGQANRWVALAAVGFAVVGIGGLIVDGRLPVHSRRKSRDKT